MSSVHNKKNGIQFFDIVKTDLSLLSYQGKNTNSSSRNELYQDILVFQYVYCTKFEDEQCIFIHWLIIFEPFFM